MPKPVNKYCPVCEKSTPHLPGGDPLRMNCMNGCKPPVSEEGEKNKGLGGSSDSERIPTTSYRAKTASEIKMELLDDVLEEVEHVRKTANLAPGSDYKDGFMKAITNINAIINELKTRKP